MACNLFKPAKYIEAKPKDKNYTINDGEGLYMMVTTKGEKRWYFTYTYAGKQKKLSFGSFLKVSTETARKKAIAARESVENKIDPGEAMANHKKAIQLTKQNSDRSKVGLPAINSFAEIAIKWLAKEAETNEPDTSKKRLSRFKRLAFPIIGHIQINDIKPPDIMAVINPILDRKQIETAARLTCEMSRVFNKAIVDGITDHNPTIPVKDQIPDAKSKKFSGIVKPQDLSKLLIDISNYQGTFIVQCAFKISPLLFQRPGEIRQMMWSEIDFIAKEWRLDISKTDLPNHIVPLSKQVIAILKEIKPVTGCGKYVFPSCRDTSRPMSENTIRTALMSLGYTRETQTAHGFRSTASTMLRDNPDKKWLSAAIEKQLSHVTPGTQGKYDEATHIIERVEMMQFWADYLDKIKADYAVKPDLEEYSHG